MKTTLIQYSSNLSINIINTSVYYFMHAPFFLLDHLFMLKIILRVAKNKFASFLIYSLSHFIKKNCNLAFIEENIIFALI